MQTIYLLDNPRRRGGKRAGRKRSITRRTRKTRLKVARSIVTPSQGSTSMKTNRRRRRRTYRRNPPAMLKKLTGNIGGNLRSGAFGAVAIAANNIIANQASKLIGATDPWVKAGVRLLSATVVTPLLIGATRIKPLQAVAFTATSLELFNMAKNLLPASAQTALSGYEFPKLPAYRPAANDTGVPGLGMDDGALPIPTVGF